jgi:hypothetical protein
VSQQSYIVGRREQIPVLMREIERRLVRGPVKVSVGARPSRSTEQNAYLHFALRELAQFCGVGEEELKAEFKRQYGPKRLLLVGSQSFELCKSTREYSKAEAMDMIAHVERVAAECGLLIAPGTL